ERSSAKKTSRSRSLCSSIAPAATLPATAIPTTPGTSWKNSLTRSRTRRCSEGKELDSTADVELDTGEVGGEVGAEEDDRVGDVRGLPGTSHRRSPDHALVHLRIAELERLRADDAGDDRVDRDPVAGALERERPRQSEQTRLGRRIARLAEAAERACDRGHV